MIKQIKDKWTFILETMKKEFELSEVSFNTWISPLKVHSLNNNVLKVLVSDQQPMMITYIKNKFQKPLQVTVSEVIGTDILIEFILPEDEKTVKKEEVPSYNNGIPKSNLNPKYTFDTFVVGNNNNFAHAACLAVAESPAEVYNPLFIYGGVGLGKTHLMQSIAHFVEDNSPQLKVKYVTSEEFTNELIESLKNQKLTNSEFREKYRNVDVLLIDDIQFIIGKESTQEEFFHTFNTLYGSNKQIIISSDKPPKEMETLEERLRTRFECGLTVDIQTPTYETSMAILDKKIEAEGYIIPFEVKDFIVNNINSNIRELEGALNKITAYSKVSKTEISLEMAKNVLKDLISPNAHREITIEYIIQVVADHFGISIADILSAKRKSEIVYPRQIAMYLCRKCTNEPLTSIGKYMGDRDHTTVIHGADKIEKEISINENTKNVIDVLIKKINPS